VNNKPLSILNIGHDRAMLSEHLSEAQRRQLYYCDRLPARIVHLVRAPADHGIVPIKFGRRLVVHPCPVPHWAAYFPNAVALGKRILSRERFDFIQVQEPYLAGAIGVCLSTMSGVPLITGLFSDEIDNPVWLKERRLNRVANMVGKYVLRYATATRTDSRAVADRVAGIGCRNLTYIPFLITDAESFLVSSDRAGTIRDQLLAGLSGPLMLAVNRLEAEKNMSLMIGALATASHQLPGLVLAIAGSGRLENLLRLEVERVLPGRVRWLGWVPGECMVDYYQAADLTLISSDRESSARILFESLLAGTPVISTATAGANEVIKDRVTGRIVPVGDEQAFASAVVELARDPVRLAEMGECGRELMRQTVTADVVVRQLREFYQMATESA
jgi:glycosyltransferase involved in cell wall biosynthesis